MQKQTNCFILSPKQSDHLKNNEKAFFTNIDLYLIPDTWKFS